MLTRLKVNGFKNLVNVDVRFGPFTCIAGVNGVGKSNLFDAITFLSNLAEKSLLDAALSVRDDGSHSGDLRSIFHRVGDNFARKMDFEAEMIVPPKGEDDLGQEAKAAITFLRYKLRLGYREDARPSAGSIEILSEELTYIKRGEARKNLLFEHSNGWRDSVITGKRFGKGFISTTTDRDQAVIKVHQDGGSQGRASGLLARTLPRTVLSAANAAESPTALLARREMQSWRKLQLEPSRLRMPDSFTAPTMLSSDGSHLAANLYELARSPRRSSRSINEDHSQRVYTEIANRLSNLIDDVREVNVDIDLKRELYTLVVSGRDHTGHAARSLSDGTLRFLALGVLQMDPRFQGVLCLEEPENGIHPARIPAMLKLLRDIATDTSEPVSADNPLRQVIINTHSPAVVAQAPDDSILMAEPVSQVDGGGSRFTSLTFCSLAGTWRAGLPDSKLVSLGNVLSYLNPLERNSLPQLPKGVEATRVSSRVIDRSDVQGSLFGEARA
ncbi:MAG: AAA family ATPase [Terracidiphilus sp.]|jgi:predicted ATPase